MKIKPISVAFHRNGVCGEPFHCVIFDMTEDGKTNRMLAVRFADDEGEGFQNPRIAVFDVALLYESNIEFGSNSFRGDHFVDEIDKAIVAKREERRKAYA
jgi:hypothetical protein